MEIPVEIQQINSSVENTSQFPAYEQHSQYPIVAAKLVDLKNKNQLSRNVSSMQHLYRNSSWMICEAIHLTCIALALYVLYALLHHRAIKFGRSKDTTRQRKGGLWLENLCIIGIIAALFRFANNQILLFTGWTSFDRCSVLLNISIALYFIAIHPVYLFLWIRQRIFYSNRALKHLYSKTVRFMSWLALFCVIVTTILSMVLFVIDTQNSAAGRVCKVSLTNDSESNRENNQLKYYEQGVKVNVITGLIGGGIQLSFLALFLYPIMDNKLQAMRTKHLRSGSVALMTLIRRSFLLAGLCILSDVGIALLVKTIHTNFHEAIFAPLAMYDVNLMINILCIIVTFRRWRVMLFPWLYSGACSGMFSCDDCCCKIIRHRSSKKYTVNYVEKPIYRASIDTVTQSGKKVNSEIIYERSRSQRRSKRCRPQAPVPDVILPILDEVESKSSSERGVTASVTTDHNQKVESEIYHYSDTFLQTSCRTYERKRSTSLILSTNVTTPSLKRAKSHITSSLLAKSKLWIMDYKAS